MLGVFRNENLTVIFYWEQSFMYDVIIIGGGPAGLTAALYTARARLKTLIIENIMFPSQAFITALIENYPGFPEGIGGPDIIEKMKKQIEPLGVETTDGEVKSIYPNVKNNVKTWIIKTEDKEFETISVIIASGAQPKELNVPGENKFKGRGVSYCAVCDGALFKDKDVVVVGGGDAAIEESLFLAKFAKSIKIIHRRNRFRAAKIIQERIINEKKIEYIWDSTVLEIVGNNLVEGVEVNNILTNQKRRIPCNGVFIFIGYTPNTSFAKGLVNLDSEGYIITDENMWTYLEGIFACGDCRKKTLRQVVTACGDGAVAAFSAQHYVENIKGTAYDKRK
jgi:thioredoxin reductase (NADPH)